MGQIVALSLWCRGTNITDLQAVCTLVLLGLNAGIPHFGYETSQITQVTQLMRLYITPGLSYKLHRLCKFMMFVALSQVTNRTQHVRI